MRQRVTGSTVRRWDLIVVAAVVLAAAACGPDLRYEPGVLVDQEPQQENLTEAQIITVGEYRVRPVARFHVEARVLSTERYRFDDGADLSPVDLALGWGRMSDQEVLDQMSISQGRRFYRWTVRQYPIPRREIIEHSANMHIIPANDDVRRDLLNVREGEIVQISGYLVVVSRDDGWIWRSSMTRKDAGDGACELIWAEDIVSYPATARLADG